MRAARKLLIAYLSVVVLIASLCLASCANDEQSETTLRESGPKADSDRWKDPESCRACHEEVYQSWRQSHHAIANRLWDEALDAEAFSAGMVDDVAGRSYRISLRPEGPTIARLLQEGEERQAIAKAVIGEEPFRQYLVEGERGRLQAHSLAWDPHLKEWFDVFGEEERRSGEWGHWTGQGMNWNSNCAECHMTEYEKNYDPRADAYRSAWTHQGISCIACHTGLEEHAASVSRGDYVPPERMDPAATMSNCASCHSRREALTDGGFEAGEDYHDHYRLTLYDNPTAYFPDGKADEENFVFGSFQHSAMGHAGVSCLDCHKPHSNELVLPAENNALCLQCHGTGRLEATFIDPESHGRHRIGTPGGSCVDCHMPHRVYMERDARRDHGFTIPDPYMTINYGTPTACVDCHQEQGAQWALDRFDEWYGESERVQDLRRRASLLSRAWEGALATPDALLERLSREENAYWQASWLRLLRPFAGSDEVAAAAKGYLGSSSSTVRSAALYALSDRSEAQPLMREALADPVRLPRIEALGALSNNGALAVTSQGEWNEFLLANADRPSGALGLASLSLGSGDRETARHLVELAVGFDRNNPLLRYDAAVLLDRAGYPQAALQHLRVAQTLDAESGLYLFAASLLQASLGDLPTAERSLSRAVALDASQHRWWYNLAILQARLGKLDEARQSLAQALELSPEENSYRAFMDNLSEPRTSPAPTTGE